MSTKDLKKALHILAWIIIWITGFMIFFMLMNVLIEGGELIPLILLCIGGAIIVLLLFSLENIVDSLDAIATNSAITASLLEKIDREKFSNKE